MYTNGLNSTKGQSTELMPSIMGAFDAILNSTINEKDAHTRIQTSTTKRSTQANNFAHLSPGVQKILSRVPDQEISKHFNSEETLGPRRVGSYKTAYRSLRSPEKSIENLDRISPNVQKILSNLSDTELVMNPNSIHTMCTKNNSYLHCSKENLKRSASADVSSFNDISDDKLSLCDNLDVKDFSSFRSELCDGVSENCESGNFSDSCKPLGSYLHSPHGIASRTPVGRKNKGKFLQVPSECSVGTNSTSSEVSRPVSLTSLGSCSSSESSGPHQPSFAYLASSESLESDNEHGGSADSGIAEQQVTPEMRVLQEVLDTETVYVADLREVIQGYLEPWRTDPEILLVPHLQHLFSNIEEIYEFNRKFLENLHRADCNPTKIANVFLQHDSGFTVYNEYCTNYPRTMDVLGRLQRDEKMVPLFKQKQIALGHALPLGSYLLKPVQRILKYHLLLQRLSKQCECEHKPVVDLALTTMTGIATNINNMKRKYEDAVRVHEIQAQLYGWSGPDLTALGELIAEGTFKLIGARAKRQVFLFDKLLLIAKRKENGILVYKSHIMCSNLMLIESVRGEPLCFHLVPFDNPKMQATLRAKSQQHKREWTLQIKRAILENFDIKIPHHARELVMELGQEGNVNEIESTNDKWSSYKPYSTPDYLERRSRIRKSRNLSNRRALSQDRSFTSLSSWRRKSEPDMIPQYTSKTMPKKISQLKKAKVTTTAKFYTDLSDSETCDIVDKSIENLTPVLAESLQDVSNDSLEDNDKTLERIVSELLQQSKPEFNKLLNGNKVPRTRRTISGEPSTSVWYEETKDMLSKADSLPRSFQLNEQISEKIPEDSNNEQLILDQSLKEIPDDSAEEQPTNDVSSHLDDERPEHKIYRKSLMRLSVVQRFRSFIFEEHRNSLKEPHSYKQGSKSMGEKIAHPDYADPQKLFLNSRNSSQISLSVDNSADASDLDFTPERVALDMSINVLKEFDKIFERKTIELSTGQLIETKESDQNEQNSTETSLNSSQNSDSYYESILDKSLVEEYVKDGNGRMIAKQDSFNSNDSKLIYEQKFKATQKKVNTEDEVENGVSTDQNKIVIKRPNKAPPPIPVKPTLKITNNTINSLSNSNSNNFSKSINKSKQLNLNETVNNSNNIPNQSVLQNQNSSIVSTSKSWVKTVVNRFE